MVEYQAGAGAGAGAGAMAGAEALDTTYAALASPIRRAMLHRLRSGPTRVTDLARPFDISLAAASKHVFQLERAGLVSRRRDGREHWLTLEARPLAEAVAWIGAYREFWAVSLDALEALLRDEQPKIKDAP